MNSEKIALKRAAIGDQAYDAIETSRAADLRALALMNLSRCGIKISLDHPLLKSFNPEQPRAPEGSPIGGRWISGAVQLPPIVPGAGAAGETARGAPDIQVAGGFDRVDPGMTAQSFISSHCKASILRVFPGQYLYCTLQQVMAAESAGDRAAGTALKLLKRDEYRK